MNPNETIETIETIEIEENKAITTDKKTLYRRVVGIMTAIVAMAFAQIATVRPASAEINESTFVPITNLIDAVIPLFTSILDLIIAVFPLVIAMAFLAGLALLINKIFDKSLNFK